MLWYAKLLQSCPTLQPYGLFTTPCPTGFSVHGILQAGILEWVAMPSSRGSPWPRGRTCVSYVSCIGRQVLYHWCHLGSLYITTYIYECVLGCWQSFPTLCDPMDCSLWGFSVHGDSAGKNTAAGCHALLISMNRKSINFFPTKDLMSWEGKKYGLD